MCCRELKVGRFIKQQMISRFTSSFQRVRFFFSWCSFCFLNRPSSWQGIVPEHHLL
jgi:hypothetical protein